ncbi:hypothetical protein TSAR_004414 [Trichomalopsis sarcophagae]|uniref:Uncharacterized protein n=1 Tax=Trichomalopsis sarcophagae TaxID=543379 RepID=A0A232EMR0_9HYME|nr:hypothetical protein TSAR_004414 [Trichomalopsis sarcophagae]
MIPVPLIILLPSSQSLDKALFQLQDCDASDTNVNNIFSYTLVHAVDCDANECSIARTPRHTGKYITNHIVHIYKQKTSNILIITVKVPIEDCLRVVRSARNTKQNDQITLKYPETPISITTGRVLHFPNSANQLQDRACMVQLTAIISQSSLSSDTNAT